MLFFLTCALLSFFRCFYRFKNFSPWLPCTMISYCIGRNPLSLWEYHFFFVYLAWFWICWPRVIFAFYGDIMISVSFLHWLPLSLWCETRVFFHFLLLFSDFFTLECVREIIFSLCYRCMNQFVLDSCKQQEHNFWFFCTLNLVNYLAACL